MNKTCTFIPVANLEDRFTFLEDSKADFSIASISVTPEREQILDFVQPYYYSAGTSIYAPIGTIDASAGWEPLKGKTVCTQAGVYAETLAPMFDLKTLSFAVDNSTEADIKQKVSSGQCIGILDDSSQAQYYGLPNSQLPPQDETPYGIAVAKGNDALKDALSAATINLMNKGPESEILALEKEWMVANGVPANNELQSVVEATSNFAVSPNSGPPAEQQESGAGSFLTGGIFPMAVMVLATVVGTVF